MSNEIINATNFTEKVNQLLANGEKSVMINDSNHQAYESGWAQYLQDNFKYDNTRTGFIARLNRPIEKSYNVVKTYESKPSKNTVLLRNVTLEKADTELQIHHMLWRKHGGLVISYEPMKLVCEEDDESERITWTIEEVE
ncbi:MAG: hypothetical protein EBZ77_02590 [Chitinophagia bacterium]|nr:hypothetical protein [Chitinophagia bacterium]